MKIVYSHRYQVNLGSHVFPTLKYSRVRDRLLERGVAGGSDFVEPQAATWDDLALVHTADYLEKVQHGRLSLEEVALMEIPWSREIVEGFRLMAGGTLCAARLALKEKWNICVHLGGGFHHAFCNHGEGFCMFNDVAVAIRRLKRDGAIARAAIVDCDVHHGNGTAAIFTGERSVFAFSMHQLHNYPAFKPPGALDIALDDRAADDEYLEKLRDALPRVLRTGPDVVFYLAGADPYEDDQLGGLRLTKKGLRARDRLVFETARAAGAPVAVTLAGGYARHVEDTIAIHVATVEEAKAALDGSAGS